MDPKAEIVVNVTLGADQGGKNFEGYSVEFRGADKDTRLDGKFSESQYNVSYGSLSEFNSEMKRLGVEDNPRTANYVHALIDSGETTRSVSDAINYIDTQIANGAKVRVDGKSLDSSRNEQFIRNISEANGVDLDKLRMERAAKDVGKALKDNSVQENEGSLSIVPDNTSRELYIG